MELKNYIDKDLISLLKHKKKKNVLLELINLVCENRKLENKEEIKKAIFHREDLMSTGIGLGIAVPHIRIKVIRKPIMAVGICKKGITDYETLDDVSVKIVVLIIAGEGQHKEYIQLLSLIVSKLKENEIRKSLIKAKAKKKIFEILIS